MSREIVIHVIITAIFLVVSLLFGVLPPGAEPYVLMFCPILFFSVLTGILCGPLYALALGVTAPFLYHFLFESVPLVPETVTLAVSAGLSGLVSGIFYELFFTSVGSSLGGILTWLMAFGMTKFICLLTLGESYFILNYISDTFVAVWPGLVTTLILVPVVTVFLRKRGAMWVLRHERDS